MKRVQPYFDNFENVQWLAGIIGEERTSQLITDHFGSVRTRLSSSDVAALYDAEYIRGLRSHPVDQMVAGVFPINKYQKPVYDFVLTYYPSGGKRVLDVGCGSGEFTLALAASGFDCTGIDYTVELIRVARDQAEANRDALPLEPHFIVGDAVSANIHGKFDVISLNDVVEHISVSELETLLKACRERLAQGGQVIVHTPNGRHVGHGTEQTFKGKLLLALLRAFGRGRFAKTLRQAFYDQVHINVMGISQLREIGQRAGFSNVRVVYDQKCSIPWMQDVWSWNMTAVLQP